MSNLSDTNKGILFALLTTFLWGFLGILLKIALKEIDALTIIWFRFVIAFIFLSGYFIVRNRRQEFHIFKKIPPLLVFAGFCLGLNYIGYIKGVELAGPGTAQILIQFAQVLLVFAGVFIFKEKLSRKQIIGFCTAVLGFVIFYNQSLGNLNTSRADYDLGVLMTLLGAVVWVVYAVIQKKLVMKFSVQQLNMIIYLVPVLMFAWFTDFRALSELSFGMWMLMILLGLNTLIAYGSLGEAFKYLEASKVSIIITLNPIITISTLTIMSYLEITIIETKIIPVLGFMGALLVVAGAVMAVVKRRKKKIQ